MMRLAQPSHTRPPGMCATAGPRRISAPRDAGAGVNHGLLEAPAKFGAGREDHSSCINMCGDSLTRGMSLRVMNCRRTRDG